MIKELEGPKHFNMRLYGIQKLVHEVESAFRNYFKATQVYYYFESCPDGPSGQCAHAHRLVWHGPGLVGFIRNTQKLSIRERNAPVLFVTPFSTKGSIEHIRNKLDDLYDEDIFGTIRYNSAGESLTYKELVETEAAMQLVEYWIGDTDRNANMTYCDRLFGILWDEIKRGVR